MPNELTIPAVQAAAMTPEPARPQVKASPRSDAPAATPRPYLNPSLRLDAALGLVVIEFRDETGKLTSTIPSQRQIDAYRAHQDAGPGPEPVGGSRGDQGEVTPQPAATADSRPAVRAEQPPLPDASARAQGRTPDLPSALPTPAGNRRGDGSPTEPVSRPAPSPATARPAPGFAPFGTAPPGAAPTSPPVPTGSANTAEPASDPMV
jgi:hypothetical protein